MSGLTKLKAIYRSGLWGAYSAFSLSIAVVVWLIAVSICDYSYSDDYKALSPESDPCADIYLWGFLVWLVLSVLSIWTFKRYARKAKAYQKQVEEYQAYQKEKLAEIKANMTPAQWAQYQLDMEIKENLERLQRNSNTTTTTTYGMFTDFSN